MAALAAAMVDRLSEASENLAESQQDLKSETSGAGAGKGDPLKAKQDEINSGAEKLQEQIDQTARSLGKFNENAMEDLLKKPPRIKGGWT